MNPKIILISGGTYGIGKGTAWRLLHDGHHAAVFSRDRKKVAMFQRELAVAAKDHALVLQGDVTDERQVKAMVQKTARRFGTIDILVNNAGFGYFDKADTVDITRFDAMIHTNLIGVTMLTKHVVPYMKKQGSGLIVNVVSISGKKSTAPLGSFYSATKFGVMGYSEGIRNELKEYGIKVCTVCPGMVDTAFFDTKELARRKKLAGGRMPTMLQVGDISSIISFICNQPPHCDIQDVTIMPFGA